MFESITENIQKAIHNLKGKGSITQINIATTVKEINKALIKADVDYKLAKNITDEIQQNAIGKNVIHSLNPQQLFIKIVNDKLIEIMSCNDNQLKLNHSPTIITLIGLQGSGKTTFSIKLANYISTKIKIGQKVLVLACDIYRPAAIDQLLQLGEKYKIDVFYDNGNKDVISIINKGIKHAKSNGYGVVIIDTAGRQVVDDAMMKEIKDINETFKPHENLLVLDAMIGQTAISTAKTFNENTPITGCIITKLDGDTSGGVALSVTATLHVPIKLIGIGENIRDIDIFYPDRMANRILGMGDVVSFVEKVQDVFDKKNEAKLEKKILNKKFDYSDMINQFERFKKVGNIKSILDMFPASIKISDEEIALREKKIKIYKYIYDSMTPKERKNIVDMNMSRKQRVAIGSGVPLLEVDQFVKLFLSSVKTFNKVAKIQKNFGTNKLLNIIKRHSY